MTVIPAASTSGHHSALWPRTTMFEKSQIDRHSLLQQSPLFSDHRDVSNILLIDDYCDLSNVLVITHNELQRPLVVNSLCVTFQTCSIWQQQNKMLKYICQKSNAFEKVLHLLYLWSQQTAVGFTCK